MRKNRDLRELATEEPDLERLREEFLWAVQRRDSSVFARQRLNYNTRFCVWGNQSSDGKKWTAPKGKEVFPWKGASDARVHLIDSLINEDVAKLMVIWKRNKISVAGTESNDDLFSTRVTQVLRWMKYTQMKEARRETKLLANYFLERGTGLMGVFWEKRRQLGYEEIDLETIQGMAMSVQQQMGGSQQFGRSVSPHPGPLPGGEGVGGSGREGTLAAMTALPEGMEPQMVAILPELIMDASREEEAAEVGRLVYPDVPVARLRKVVRDLRETGVARFPRPYVKSSRPCLVALGLNEEVFMPPEATELQEATGIYRRELLSETKLRERIGTHDWDEGWVEEVIKTQRGRVTADFQGNVTQRIGMMGVTGRGALEVSKLFEVVHGYRRLGDEEGVPGIFYTCFSPGMTKGERRNVQAYASHGLLDYDHGGYPFVLFEREGRSRLVDDSRGYGEVGATWQGQVKAEWDSRIDRCSIATLPPSYYPVGEAPDAWGPGVRIGTHRPDDYGFLKTPQYDPMSKEVEGTVERFARRYFGRVVDELDTVGPGALQQELADNWMAGHAQVDTQVLQLMQQFMPDGFYYRVVGSNKGQGIHAKREEIQGEFDVSIGLNVDDLDPNMVKEKLDLVERALQMDQTGRVDRDEALTVAFELIDPNMGERLLRPGEEASAKEVEDEKLAFTQLRAGIPVDVKESGQAWKTRLQVLRQLMQSNPGAQKQYQEDEQFKELLDKRVKQLNFQVTQHEVNPMVGRLGG